jgi:hypothetical protein
MLDDKNWFIFPQNIQVKYIYINFEKKSICMIDI